MKTLHARVIQPPVQPVMEPTVQMHYRYVVYPVNGTSMAFELEMRNGRWVKVGQVLVGQSDYDATITIPVDPLSAIMHGAVQHFELGINDSVLALINLLK